MLKNLDIFVKYAAFLAIIIVFFAIIGDLTYRHPKGNYITNNKPAVNSTPAETDGQYRMGMTFTDDKSELIDLREGIADFDIIYSGNSDFSASILRTDGGTLNNLMSCSGPHREKKSIIVPETGVYVLSVKCKGEWSISRK